MNVRKCNKCDGVIEPTDPLSYPANLAAWLAGYCSSSCERNHAQEIVDRGEAWWQKAAALVLLLMLSLGAVACNGRPLDVPEPAQVDAGADLSPAPQGYMVSADMTTGIVQPNEPAYIDADLLPACTNCGQDAGQ